MSPLCLSRAVLATAVLCSAMPLAAQSLTVFDSGEDARRCSRAAEIAAGIRTASSEDLEYCDLALSQARLGPSERAGTHVNRGILRSVLGDREGAVADYDRALEIQPGLPEAWVGRGNILFIENNLAGAITEYDRALVAGVNRRHVVLLNRGMALEARGDSEAAERDYRAALELVPGWPLAQSRIDRVLARRDAAKRTGSEP